LSEAAPFPPLASETARGTARVDGTGIAWRAYGEGEPVLMIMGFMGSGRAWFRLLPHVSESHRAVVLDNRGTGESDRPLGLWSMEGLAADAVAVMDDAGIETAHVLGASMGGMIAQHVALDHPERVRSLTLACTHPGGPQHGPPPWRMYASLALRPVLGAQRTFPIVAPLLYAERTRRERPARLEEDGRFRVREQTPILTAPSQAAAIFRHDTRARLPELDMPVLVVHGEEDRLIPPSHGRELARLIPQARLELIPHCGHLLSTDAEEEVASALLEFIDRVDADVGATAGSRAR
jgi:pimeloyl-ACP methyl ester carboxylesterase